MSLGRRTLALALATTPGIGGDSVARILTRNDLLGRSPDDFASFSPEVLVEEYGLRAPVAQAWCLRRETHLPATADAEERLQALGVFWLTPADAGYPQRLESFDPDPPGVLYLYGNTRLLGGKTFAVPASRKAPPKALGLMENLTEAAILAGEILVTGHDTPEYQRTAVVPLRWGAPRILCLDRGMFEALGPDLREEPFRAARLWRFQFDPATDLVVSPIHPESTSHPVANRIRDRLVAGLADRLILTWVTAGGNMHRMAKLALTAGRVVQIDARLPVAAELLRSGAQQLPPVKANGTQ